MALPKRRQSKARSRKRRTHYKSTTVSTTTCPQCNSTKMPHRACPNCGYYKGRPVISTSRFIKELVISIPLLLLFF